MPERNLQPEQSRFQAIVSVASVVKYKRLEQLLETVVEPNQDL
jgi:hypothetical protein